MSYLLIHWSDMPVRYFYEDTSDLPFAILYKNAGVVMCHDRVYVLPSARRTGYGPGSYAAFRRENWNGTTSFVTDGTRLTMTNLENRHRYDLVQGNDSIFVGYF
jgi:hypothetical protein